MKLCLTLIQFGLLSVAFSAQAETFYLKNGNVIRGTILRSLGNTFSIKLDSSGMRQLPEEAVASVEIATVDGGRVFGGLVGWDDGTYLLSVTGLGVVEVKEGVVSERVDDSQTLKTERQSAPTARSPTEEHQPGKKLEPTM